MIDFAYTHKEKINKEYRKMLIEHSDSKFLKHNPYTSYDLAIEKDSWNDLEFVSITKKGKILGFFRFSINVTCYFIKQVYVFRCDRNSKYTEQFMMDYTNVFKKIFEEYNYNKICFTCIIGSPAEKLNDITLKLNGGRIVGVLKNHAKLIDGKIYDVKLYEVENKNK